MMVAGIQKYLMGQPLIMGRQTYTPQEVVDIVQGVVTTGQGILDARVALTAAIQADVDARAKIAAFMRGLRMVVQGMFNETPDVLAVFGMTPRKTGKKTVAVKVVAAQKSLATRKARGTLGKKQRLRITGKTRPAVASSATTAPAPAVSAPTEGTSS
jgi:hypothetical protein